jgi:autotransporter-associated beta strand protein
LIKAGDGGPLVLTGTNSFTGTTSILSGRIQLAGAGTLGSGDISIAADTRLVIARADAFTLRNRMSGSGIVALAAAGVLKLTGDNSYSGGTLLSGGGGTILLGSSTALGSGAVEFGLGGDKLDLNGFSTIIGGLHSHNGFNYGIVTNSGSVPSTLTIAGSTDGTYGGTIEDGTGGVALVKAGTGTQTLEGSNTHSGGTTISAGTLQVANGGALGSGVTALAGGTLRTNLNGDLSARLSWESDASRLEAVAGTTVTLRGEFTTTRLGFPAGGREIHVGSATATGTIVFGQSSIGGTSEDRWFIDGGVVRSRLLGGSLKVAAQTNVTGELDFAGGDGFGAEIGNLLGTGIVRNDGGTTTVQSGNFAGTFTGTQNLIVGTSFAFDVPGTLIVTGTNDYSGTTTIEAGATLQVGAGGSGATVGTLGGGNVVIEGEDTAKSRAAGQLVFARSNDLTVANAIGGGGSLTQAGRRRPHPDGQQQLHRRHHDQRRGPAAGPERRRGQRGDHADRRHLGLRGLGPRGRERNRLRGGRRPGKHRHHLDRRQRHCDAERRPVRR